MNIDMAQGTHFRGMKLALAEIDRRYGGKRIEDDDFVDRMILSNSDPRHQVSLSRAHSDDRPGDPQRADGQPASQTVPMADFSKFAEDVIAQNAKESRSYASVT